MKNNDMPWTKAFLRIAFIPVMLMILLIGCAEADKVDYNLTQEARQFNVERRVIVYNARTDKIILEIEGYIDIENSGHDELAIMARVGDGMYKKNYVYLNDYTLYTVEDITGTHTDPYHYKMYFHEPGSLIPDVEIVD